MRPVSTRRRLTYPLRAASAGAREALTKSIARAEDWSPRTVSVGDDASSCGAPSPVAYSIDEASNAVPERPMLIQTPSPPQSAAEDGSFGRGEQRGLSPRARAMARLTSQEVAMRVGQRLDRESGTLGLDV